jgi:hypothetical protein
MEKQRWKESEEKRREGKGREGKGREEKRREEKKQDAGVRKGRNHETLCFSKGL